MAQILGQLGLEPLGPHKVGATGMSTYSRPSFSSSSWKRGGVWMNSNYAWYLKNGWRYRLSYYILSA